MQRVAGVWNTRLGSRVRTHVVAAIRAAAASGGIRRRGEFMWSSSDACPLRSRDGMRVPADRIAPEEYAEAVRAVLGGGHAFARTELVAEVRAVLGFSRTGSLLEEAIVAIIDRMLADGALGEGSAGMRLRSGTQSHN